MIKNMTATAHALIGVAIASKLGNPYLAVPIAIASHVAADMVPHWDTNFDRKKMTKIQLKMYAAADVILSFITASGVSLLFFPQTNIFYSLIIVFFAQLPDWFLTPYYFFGIKQFKWAYDFGKATNREAPLPRGIINQIIVVGLVLLIAKVF